MLTHIALPNYSTLKKLLCVKPENVVTIPQYVTTHLNARRMIKQFLNLTDCASGLIIEGMPGLGKTTLVKHYLEHHSIPYRFLHALAKDDAEQQLHDAFHNGEVVVINELNTMPFLEYSLNIFMMGEDLSGANAKNKGFRVIATQNPISFGGRYALSPAIRKSFFKSDCKRIYE